MKVADYMYTALVTVTPGDLVSFADEQMRTHRIRHLPVVSQDQQLVGIVSDRDLRQAAAADTPTMGEHELLYLLDKMTVKDVMTRQVLTVSAETTLEAAGQLFLDKKVGCLPVVGEGQHLIGMITITDLLYAYVQQHDKATQG